MPDEAVYTCGQRSERCIYILLFGRCKMKLDDKNFGTKMGAGYTFNEQVLFEKDQQNKETLITCDESAFLKLTISLF